MVRSKCGMIKLCSIAISLYFLSMNCSDFQPHPLNVENLEAHNRATPLQARAVSEQSFHSAYNDVKSHISAESMDNDDLESFHSASSNSDENLAQEPATNGLLPKSKSTNGYGYNTFNNTWQWLKQTGSGIHKRIMGSASDRDVSSVDNNAESLQAALPFYPVAEPSVSNNSDEHVVQASTASQLQPETPTAGEPLREKAPSQKSYYQYVKDATHNALTYVRSVAGAAVTQVPMSESSLSVENVSIGSDIKPSLSGENSDDRQESLSSNSDEHVVQASTASQLQPETLTAGEPLREKAPSQKSYYQYVKDATHNALTYARGVAGAAVTQVPMSGSSPSVENVSSPVATTVAGNDAAATAAVEPLGMLKRAHAGLKGLARAAVAKVRRLQAPKPTIEEVVQNVRKTVQDHEQARLDAIVKSQPARSRYNVFGKIKDVASSVTPFRGMRIRSGIKILQPEHNSRSFSEAVLGKPNLLAINNTMLSRLGKNPSEDVKHLQVKIMSAGKAVENAEQKRLDRSKGVTARNPIRRFIQNNTSLANISLFRNMRISLGFKALSPYHDTRSLKEAITGVPDRLAIANTLLEKKGVEPAEKEEKAETTA